MYLCPDCAGKIDVIGKIACKRCGAPLDSEICGECRGKRFHFDSANCYGYYAGVLREAIHQYKYSGNRQLAPQLGSILSTTWKERDQQIEVDFIVPVPIHRQRERERGFNQSLLLAEIVSKDLSLPVLQHGLLRTRATKPQVNLALEDRGNNVKGAFTPGSDSVEGKNLILIDDVFTTGMTLDEAAKTLKTAGAASVHALVLARSL
ncbi:MAG: ComF family protein [Lentisphaerae bacterium]|nr:ComF family protein [Lentisphaerota bacterium]